MSRLKTILLSIAVLAAVVTVVRILILGPARAPYDMDDCQHSLTLA